ncbi:proteasome subunit beta type-4 [Contarinia nasturtii]|uniref:proteasome subunit beta type-4 n=1 Tax=Contarinia nasturtii TaxID=265458 RepID=UPI0012D3D83B|nr:proteasome subunit beta type-4 [Contarinia nasturtii]
MFNQTPNFNNPLWTNGPQPGNFYNFPGSNSSMKSASNNGSQRSAYPIATGSSVVGIRYNEGVLIAADTLVSYGSLASFRNVDRVFTINDNCVLGAGADYADFQCIKHYIDEKITEDFCHDDKIEMKPKSLYNWLTRCMYNRRCRMNPWWIDLVVGGVQDGEPFLGHVDVRGRAYEDKVVATGYGKHLAIPLLREYSENPNAVLDYDAAQALLKKCMEVLFYRDCRSYHQYKVAVCTKDGSKVLGPINVEQNWQFATSIKGYA